MTKFITLEGMSGTGKDVQRERLENELRAAYVDVVSFSEPTFFLEEFIQTYRRRETRDPYVELHLFTADRRQNYRELIEKSHRNHEDVLFLQARSWISTLAYQGYMQGIPSKEIIEMNAFYPQFDLALILLADPEVAIERIIKRNETTGKQISKDETLEKLKKVYDAYQEAAVYLGKKQNSIIINANGTEEEVYTSIKKEIKNNLDLLQRGIFIDKDGTIVKNYKNYKLNPPTDELLEDALEGISLFPEVEGKKIIVSNQPWARRGTMTEARVAEIFTSVEQKIANLGGKLDKYYYCPHLDEDNCPDKKPNPGMIERGIREFHLDRENSWIIGDGKADMLAGINANIQRLLVLSGCNEERLERDKNLANIVKDNFTEAMNFLKKY